MKPLLNSNFLSLLGGIIFIRIGWFASLPFMAIYLSKVLNCSPIEIGLILGSGPFATCIAGFFGGSLADKYGNRLIMLSSILLSAVVFSLFLIANQIFIFCLLNIFLGILRSFFDASSKSYITNIVPIDVRGKAFSWRYIAINIGAALGAPIASSVFFISPKYIFFITAISYLITFFVFLCVIKYFPCNSPDNPYIQNIKNAAKTAFKCRPFLYLILIGIIVYLALSQLDSTIPLMLQARFSNYLFIYTVFIVMNAFIVIAFNAPLDMIRKYLGNKYFAYFSIITYSVAFLLLALSSEIYTLYLAVFFLSIGEMANINLFNVLIDQHSPKKMKGAYFGLASFSMLGLSIGPILGGAFLKYWGSASLYLIISSLIVFCFYLYFLVNKENNIQQEQAAQEILCE